MTERRETGQRPEEMHAAIVPPSKRAARARRKPTPRRTGARANASPNISPVAALPRAAPAKP